MLLTPVPPSTTVEPTTGTLRELTRLAAETCEAERLSDVIVAVEMTGNYHRPVYSAFRKVGFANCWTNRSAQQSGKWRDFS